MQTSGKFYIWLNVAAAKPHYWSKFKQDWTLVPTEASFFDTRKEAEEELDNAGSQGIGEPVVYQATRNI